MMLLNSRHSLGRCIAVIGGLLTVLSCGTAAELNLIPRPASIKHIAGQTTLGPATRIVCGDPAARGVADLLAEELHWLHRLQVTVVAGTDPKPGDILLRNRAALSSEKYRLTVDGLITIEAGSVGGFHAGTATLVQAVRASAGLGTVPNMAVEDEPFRDFRALMIDVKRQHHSPAIVYQLIRLCRFYKVRYLSLHTGEPQWIGAVMESSNDAGGTFSPLQMADFIAYGRRLGVYLFPHNESTPHFPTLQQALTENLTPAGPFQNFPDEFDGQGPYAFDGKPDDRFWAFMREATRRAVDQFAAGYPGGKLPYYHVGPVFGEGGMDTQTAARFLDIILEKDSDIRVICWDGLNARDKFLAPRRKSLIIAYYSGAYSSSKIHDYLREGWDVINAPFYPLYVLGGSDKPASEDIFRDWNVLAAGKGETKGELVQFDTEASWRAQVLGGMLCTWEISPQEQIRQLRRRLPIFAEHAWNHQPQPYPPAAFTQFQERFQVADRLVDRVLDGPEDRLPPSTVPVGWKHEPAALGNIAIMQAAPLVDPSGVEYRFECVEGGGPSSGWQHHSYFVAEDLQPHARCAWRVKVRDGSPARNESPWSVAAAVTTGEPFPTKLVAHFIFDEEIRHGRPAADSIGNLRGAVYSNQVQPREFPWSLFFGGRGVQVEGGWTCVGLGGTGVINPLSGNFSVALWLAPNKEPYRQLFVSSKKDGQCGFSILTKDDHLVLDTGSGGNGFQYQVPIQGLLVPRQWSHVAVTFARQDSGRCEAKFFVDGRQIGQTQVGAAAPAAGPGWSLNETSIVGAVADVRVYQGTLCDQQVRFLAKPHPAFRVRPERPRP